MLRRWQKKFTKFPTAFYSSDVTFQQSNRPGGNMAEGKSTLVGSTCCIATTLEHLLEQMGFALYLIVFILYPYPI